MPEYNKRNIKKYKGRMVLLVFIPKKYHEVANDLTGEITASTNDHILFKVNKSSPEIPLRYSQIVEIKEPEK